jgi:hypothetical protein
MHARRVSILIPILIPMAAVLLAGQARAQAALPDLRGARAFSVMERWPAREPGQTVSVGYVIERQDDAGFYAGGGRFAVRDGDRIVRRRNALFSIPPEEARRFLAALSTVPLAAAADGSEPLPGDSAAVSLTVQVEGAEVEFLLASGATRMRPWQVTVRGAGPERRLVSDSDAIWRAFHALHPRLKRDVLEALRRGEDGG